MAAFTVDFPTIAFIAGTLANLVLAGFVLFRNPRNATHILFASLSTILIFDSIVIYISVVTTNYLVALWTIRLSMSAAILQSINFALLMRTFPRAGFNLSKAKAIFLIAITVVGVAVTLSPFLFPSIEFREGVPPQPQEGPGLIVFVPIAIGSLAWGFWLMIRKNWKSKGIERVQQRYLLLGFLTTFGLLVGLVFVNVSARQDTRFVIYSPIFTLPFVLLTAYAIIRYRLMDIRLAVARALSYFFLVGAVLLIYGLALVSAVPVISDLTQIDDAIVAAGAALISIPIARLVQKLLTKLTDRFLFQSNINYQKALARIGQDLSATIDINEATQVVLDAMQNIFRARKAIIMLHDPRTGTFEPEAFMGIQDFEVVVPSSHVLPDHLRHTQNILVKDELVLEEEREKSKTHKEELQIIKNAFEWLDMSVVVPLFVNKELTGLILLGEKLSGTPYLQGDVEFLTALATQAGVNLENARLYTESLKFGKKLEEEVKRATQELESANMQLKNLDKAKSEFLSIASHQLRTPLTALRGYVSMIKEGDFGEIPDQQKPVLDILDKSAMRLIDLINSLLDISRIESGRLELNLESIDLSEMANELVRDLIPNAIAKKLELEFHQPKETLPHVVVDKQRVRQVMLNFIDNGIKYTEKGRVDVYVGKEGDQVIFWVEDTGKGISKEDLARLFNKFTRVGGSSRFHTEGTGLGLYVARQIVKEHRGEVHVDSAGEGKGSTFAMNLPAEGTANSLKPGEKAQVTIKAAEAQK